MRFIQWEWRIIQYMRLNAGGLCRTRHCPESTVNLRLWGNIQRLQFPGTGIFFLCKRGRVHPVGHPPCQVKLQWVIETGSTLLSWVLLCSHRFQIPLASHPAFPQSSSLLPWRLSVISEPPGTETKHSLDLFTSLSSWFLISDFSLILQLHKFFQNFMLSQLLPKLYNF